MLRPAAAAALPLSLAAAVALLCLLAPTPTPGQGDKTPSDAWARIVADNFTKQMSAKALELQEKAVVKAETELRYSVKDLGGAGKLSVKAITKKYGPPAKVEKYASNVDGKVIRFAELHYPPISLSVAEGSDEPTTVNAPKRLWAGKGILENANEALKKK
jgi:hypothetical protein